MMLDYGLCHILKLSFISSAMSYLLCYFTVDLFVTINLFSLVLFSFSSYSKYSV